MALQHKYGHQPSGFRPSTRMDHAPRQAVRSVLRPELCVRANSPHPNSVISVICDSFVNEFQDTGVQLQSLFLSLPDAAWHENYQHIQQCGCTETYLHAEREVSKCCTIKANGHGRAESHEQKKDLSYSFYSCYFL